jgi:hypothetical protein
VSFTIFFRYSHVGHNVIPSDYGLPGSIDIVSSKGKSVQLSSK